MPISENRRVDSIRVRLSDDMMERFEALANRYGMPTATLGAFAISRFVLQEEDSAAVNRDVQRLLASRRVLLDQSKADVA